MSTIFLVLALICVAAEIISSIAVTAYVSRRGIKINYLLWRIMIFKYFNDYCRLTREETGRNGIWYYLSITAMILALIFVIIGVILK